ncbi:MAG: PVC-type heme-binding CxxCH protein, partial [Pirellulales bacterium]
MTYFRHVVAAVGACLLIASACWAQKPADEELQTLRVPDGFDVSLFASEPLITNPSAIDIDTHGRVWVAEIQWYRSKAKDPPADKIKVLEDTDGDGRADKVTVFAEGIFAPMSICVAGDKVYVATSPDLWVYEDKNHDLMADGPPTKLLTGFGGKNHDHGAHSLVLGPDHKWWMAHGDTGFNVTGLDGSQIEFKWGAMLRGELDGTKLETVAVNFRNPYEIAVNSFGEAFCSDNDNDGNFSVRICWILEGGNYGWFGGPPFKKEELDQKVPPGTPFREHWHFRGFTPGYVPATLVTGFGSPCGMCLYEGDAFGPDYTAAPIHADAGPREVRIYRHEKSGFGYQATSQNILTTDGDNYFRPDDVCTAPDGSLLVSDWYDGGVGGHAYNDPDRGRIFRLTPTGKKLSRQEQPGPYANIPDALTGLKSPNLATQFLARERLLAEGTNAVGPLSLLASQGEAKYRARALWLLDRIGAEGQKAVVAQLDNSDPAFRALAVRILRRHGDLYADAILKLIDDADGEVRREVTLATRDIGGDRGLAALAKIALTYDGTDRYQLETINAAAADRKDDLYARLDKAGKWKLTQLPLMQVLNDKAAAAFVQQALANAGTDAEAAKALLAVAGDISSAEAGRGLLKIVANEKSPADLRALALTRVVGNLSGSWKELAGEALLTDTLRKVLADPALQSQVLTAIGEQGLNALGADVTALATSASAGTAARQQAIKTLSQLRVEGLSATLSGLLADPKAEIQAAAVDALADQQDARVLRDILTADKAQPELQTRAVDRLMSGTGGALVVLRFIDEKKLPASLQQQAIAKATSHPDVNVRLLFERFIPVDQRPKRLGDAIKPEEILALQGDAARGEQIFFNSSAAQCKTCHRAKGVGGTLGPDLSQIGKKYELKTLLETILQPSKAIAPEFIPYLVETTSGQIFIGFLVEKGEQQVVLRDVKNELLRISTAEIEDMSPQQKSLMPELVLKDVSAQDAADMLAYLAGLRDSTTHVDRFRVLGPFDSSDDKGLDKDFGIEQSLDKIDLTATLPGIGGKTNRWEEVACINNGGFLSVDQVKYCQGRGLKTDHVTNYFLVHADSAADQTAEVLIGSDDGCKVWVTGKLVHEFNGSR